MTGAPAPFHAGKDADKLNSTWPQLLSQILSGRMPHTTTTTQQQVNLQACKLQLTGLGIELRDGGVQAAANKSPSGQQQGAASAAGTTPKPKQAAADGSVARARELRALHGSRYVRVRLGPAYSAQAKAPSAHSDSLPQGAPRSRTHVLLQQWGAEVVLRMDNQAGALHAHGAAGATHCDRPDGHGHAPAFILHGSFGGTRPSQSQHPSGDMGGRGGSQGGAHTAAAQGSHGSSAAAATLSHSGGWHLQVDLNALVLELTPEALALGACMLDRFLAYMRYQRFWACRPQVSVSTDPSAWWRHAAQAVISDCRQHYPLRSFRQSLQRRGQCIKVYRELHARQAGFLHVPWSAAPAASGAHTLRPLASQRERLKQGLASVAAAPVPGTISAAGRTLHSLHASSSLSSAAPLTASSLRKMKPPQLQALLQELESQITLGQVSYSAAAACRFTCFQYFV